MLENKKILVGVCGSIAAYKAAMLVRLLVKAKAEVKVVMTPDASHFVSALTFSTLSKNPVVSALFDPKSGSWNEHVAYGLWADAMVIAPATANTLAKCANGFCDNFLTAAYLSAKCPVFFAPAMDLDMYKHPATLNNLNKLVSFPSHYIIPAGYGELASGLVGEGRLAEPEDILHHLTVFFEQQNSLKGKNVLVTAGPTYEKIDPVRFIGNFSSGKMGFRLAEELAHRGANVELISGPSSQVTHHPKITRTDILSASDMHEAVFSKYQKADFIFMAAAVADYTIAKPYDQKVKKEAGKSLSFETVPTRDILTELGEKKTKEQVLIGFALETENEIENARRKLERKNLDYIVLNSLNDKGAGFAANTNKITILGKGNTLHSFPLKDKSSVAVDIIETCLLKRS